MDGVVRTRVTVSLCAVFLCLTCVGCGTSSQPHIQKRSASPATRKPVSILSSPVQPTTFARARAAVLALYRTHSAVRTFTARDVFYTPATRDKVLKVCHEAGPEKTAQARESSRVLACAPLIFFYYSFGRRAAVPAAIDVARRLYWYAVEANTKPDFSGPVLTRLLRSWGVA